jgi:predicted transcriptional regulator
MDRVTYRAADETIRRLQELAEKYGVSRSALITMLVHQRWLDEAAITSQQQQQQQPQQQAAAQQAA